MIVRRDLPIGILAAQCVHAAGESSPGNLPAGTNAVVLSVPDEAALRQLARKLTWAGVAHVLVLEPDAPFDGAAMAIGCVPAPRKEVARYLSSLPLLR